MIGFLREHFADRSNASIAESLGICRRCVAVKARELGLEKNTRQNRTYAVRTIIENYGEKSYTELARLANISKRTVQRIVAELGLERNREDASRLISRRRTELIQRERRRICIGLPPISKMKVVSNVHRINLKHRLKKAGYTVLQGSNVIFYTAELKRSPVRESNGIRLGLDFRPYPEMEPEFITQAI